MAYVLTMKKSGTRMTYVAATPEAALAKPSSFAGKGFGSRSRTRRVARGSKTET
jgi:hypothetical protein